MAPTKLMKPTKPTKNLSFHQNLPPKNQNHKVAKSKKEATNLTFHHPSIKTKTKTQTQAHKPTKPQKEYKGPQVFRGKEMALSGSFINAGKPVNHEKVGKWITQHGGEYVTEVGSETTHLICTIEDFKKKTPNVKNALERNKLKGKKVQIISFDWIEDCLIPNKKRSLLTNDYTLKKILAELKERAASEGKHRKNFKDEDIFERDRVTDWAKGFHRIYYDGTAFEYKVELRRVEVGRERTRVEKYTLFLFQYIGNPIYKPKPNEPRFIKGNPSHFMTAAQLNETIITSKPPTLKDPTPKPTQTHRPISYFREYCIPRDFWSAFADFRHFFHEKTGVDWDERLGREVEGKFQYVRPKEGKPVGWLPPRRKGRARYPELPVEDEAGIEEAVKDTGMEQVAVQEGHNGGSERMTELPTPEIAQKPKGVEAMDFEMSIEIPFSKTSSTTLRGDIYGAGDQINGDSLDLTMEDPVGDDDGTNAIVISDDEDSEISEAVERKFGDDFDDTKPVEISHNESCESFEDFEGFEALEGIEGGVVEGLMKGD